MRLRIPPARIKVDLHADVDGSCLVAEQDDAQHADAMIEGGSHDPAPRASRPQHKFLLVNAQGVPLEASRSEKHLPFRMYYALKPSHAAVKAYYAYLRAVKPAGQQRLDATQEQLKAIRAAAIAHGSEGEALERYMNLAATARVPAPALVRLRRPEQNTTRSYIVGYLPVLKPNRHELQKGIVKVAHARLLKGEPPEGMLQIESAYPARVP
jgi:hypothetical protein